MILDSSGVGIGALISDGILKDTASAYIYKQNPESLDEEKAPIFIRSGQLMDLWLSPVMIYLKDTLNNTQTIKEIK